MAKGSNKASYEPQHPLEEFKKLFPLAPPDLGSARYANASGGYASYVQDYLLYVTTLNEIRTSAKLEAEISKVSPKLVPEFVPATAGTVTKYSFTISGEGLPTDVALPGPVAVDETRQYDFMFKNKNVKVSLQPRRFLTAATVKGHTLSVDNPKGLSKLIVSAVPTLYKTGTAATSVKFVPAPVKVKGPAKTEPKVRTAEEIAARKAKDDERKTRSAWFKTRSLELKKGKVEEKLARSVQIRSSLIAKADSAVVPAVDLDGWKIVTHKKQINSRVQVRQTTKDGNSTKVERFTTEGGTS